jgi:hypothetical protein
VAEGRGAWWRGLWDQMRSYSGHDWAEDVLLPWVEGHQGDVDSLHEMGQPAASDRAASEEQLWDLYALSRVLDVLISPFQPVDPTVESIDRITPPRWELEPPTPDAYAAFCQALNLTPMDDEPFHPFLHEIVSVDAADDGGQPPMVTEYLWPGQFAGSLLLVRGRVEVTAGADWLDPVVATTSTLYWAWWRRNRVVTDFSHGWGHNSQWRTEFRRDYWTNRSLRYNVDAVGYRRPTVGPLALDPDDPTPAETIELLRYRHSTTRDLGGDAWPWHQPYTEAAPQS